MSGGCPARVGARRGPPRGSRAAREHNKPLQSGESCRPRGHLRRARRVSRTRSDRSREVPPRLLRSKTPGRNAATRGVSPLVAAQQTTLTLATAPAPRASPAPRDTSARARGPSLGYRKETASPVARAAASPDEFCAPPPVFWEWSRRHTITSPAAPFLVTKHQHRSTLNAAAAGHHHQYPRPEPSLPMKTPPSHQHHEA